MKEIFIHDFDYSLPDDRIAAFPLEKRDASRLLVYKNGNITDSVFSELSEHLNPGGTIVLNNTRVIEARIFFQKPTGGMIEIFCLEPHNPPDPSQALANTERVEWQCLIGGASKWKPGQLLKKSVAINGSPSYLTATYIGKQDDHFIIEFSWTGKFTFADVLHAAGNIPLPPYIKRAAVISDAERYQTVFANKDGSVAAPTASLHFTKEVFAKLEEKEINRCELTLHVGAGTFKPVKSETISEHQMHGENFSITLASLDKLMAAKSIIAAGTTSLRSLESLYWMGVKLKRGDKSFVLEQWECYEYDEKNFSYQESLALLHSYMDAHSITSLSCRTSLLIQPGYHFYSADALITNFHQPRSTLLLLVAAFVGDGWKHIYDHAMENNYRFLSYGDSSLLWRKK